MIGYREKARIPYTDKVVGVEGPDITRYSGGGRGVWR